MSALFFVLTWELFCFVLFCFSLLSERKRGRERRREREKHWSVVSQTHPDWGSNMPGPGTKPRTQVCALKGNQTYNLLGMDWCSNQLNHTGQCTFALFKNIILSLKYTQVHRKINQKSQRIPIYPLPTDSLWKYQHPTSKWHLCYKWYIYMDSSLLLKVYL